MPQLGDAGISLREAYVVGRKENVGERQDPISRSF